MVLSRIETRYEALEVPDWPVCQESGIGCRRKMRAAFPEKRSLEVCSGACWNPVFAELIATMAVLEQTTSSLADSAQLRPSAYKPNQLLKENPSVRR
jgi:hypothetical protein